MMKIVTLVVIGLTFLFDVIRSALELRSAHNKIPNNVCDVYDNENYNKWLSYHKKNVMLKIITTFVEDAIMVSLLIFNVFPMIEGLVADNSYLQCLVVLGFYLVISFVCGFISEYIQKLVIDKKYGFTTMGFKVFLKDQIKSFILMMILTLGLIELFAVIHIHLGVYTILLFTGILLIVLFLFIKLYPKLSKVFNKFEPLEDGELKEKLTALLTKHGFTVKGIQVMKASEKTTKSNAYFSGSGTTKTIVLYDNLINTLTPDEIVAVFAHELGHGVHHDSRKNFISNILLVLVVVSLAFLTVSFKDFFTAFGFKDINYGFALIILMNSWLPFAFPLLGLFSNFISRRAEYNADLFAKNEGYSKELSSSLKKLAKSNFVNLSPNRFVVLLTYSHPTISDRINRLEK